jgi:glycosyltransferase involved in cell wall biosynthesis
MLLPCPLQAQLLKVLPVATARRIVQKQARGEVVAAAPTANPTQRRPHLFIDVSVFSRHDAGTGIQRVVREVLAQLFQSPEEAFTVVPVAATRHNGYRTTAVGLAESVEPPLSTGQAVLPVKGDVFLGLDLAAHLLPHHYPELLRWKRAGVSIQMVVYDLLPALRPDWFNPKAVKNFNAWLKALAIFADRFHCISHTVKAELMRWFQGHYGIALKAQNVSVFPLGSNLAVARFTGQPAALNNPAHQPAHQNALAFAQQQPTALMVGTIEPRKGHAEVIAAFLDLWRNGSAHQLIVVGTPGWKTEAVQQALTDAAATTSKVVWLQDADDNLLAELYRAASGVIVASKGEGFGLPLIEAAYYGQPVLARDIPVFREVARGNVTFFPDLPNSGLTARTLATWLASCTQTRALQPASRLPDWATTTAVLLGNTGLTQALPN